MKIKYFFIQNTKALFAYLKLHIIFEPFSNILIKLAYLSKQSKWINENKKLVKSDYFTWDRRREKRMNLYKNIIDNHLLNSPFNYLEFGVANGESFYWWLENNNHSDSKFHGFDTFSGLPEDWGGFKKGDMNNGNKILATKDQRAFFYQGLFQQTLPSFLQKFSNDKKMVVHLDADLYSSTLYALTTLAPYLKNGDIILFDEFCVPTHEFLAFKNFTESYYINLKIIEASNNFLFTAFQVQ